MQEAKQNLEKKITQDKISRHLRRRPSKEDLNQELFEEQDENVNDQPLPNGQGLSARAKYALAFKAAARLKKDELITLAELGNLKDLIIQDDEKIVAAIECFDIDHEAEEVKMNTFFKTNSMFNGYVDARYVLSNCKVNHRLK